MVLMARGIAVLTAALASVLAVQSLIKRLYSRRKRYVVFWDWRVK